MREATVRRFSRFQVIAHWAIALPYLFLAVTGGLILAHRLGVPLLTLPLLSALHRAAGLVLIGLIVQVSYSALVSGRLRAMTGEIAGWFRIGPRDVLWLLMVPLNILWPRRVHLPPAGRYNAGQKLHGAFIVLALALFSVTGVVMILRSGELRAWLVHLWLFFGAVGFLALHLYLALLNPSTRRALGGMFSGQVPRSYAEEHHPLELPEGQADPAQHGDEPVVSLKAMLVTGAVAAVIAGASVWEYEAGPTLARAAAAARGEHAMISPGALAAAHADDPRAAHCAACHQGLGPPQDQACLACHDEVARAITSAAGYHGKLTGECRTCHFDHRGRDADIRNFLVESFNHEQARFRLEGKHQGLACDQCHLDHSGSPGRRHFIGLAFGHCVDCHADPHVDQFDQACASCHGESGWAGRHLKFDHGRDSAFKLDAVHQALACSACHKSPAPGSPVAYRTLDTSCESCHDDVAGALAGKLAGRVAAADPHFGRVACADCHAPDVPSPTPSQYAHACQECHGPAYRAVYFEWQKALDARLRSAEETARRKLPADPAAASLGRTIGQARAAGMHNVRLTSKVLDELGRP